MDYTILGDFFLATGIDVAVIDIEGSQIFSSVRSQEALRLQSLLDEICSDALQCRVSMIYGSYQAHRFGGRYIFFCPRGLVYFASPLVRHGQMTACAIAGPVLMTDYDEYIELDIFPRYAPSRQQLDKLRAVIHAVPLVGPERVRALSEQLFVSTAYLSDKAYSRPYREQENQKLQSHISEYIKQVKREADKDFYPMDKETALLAAISRGDSATARALLNEILGHVLLQSGSNLEMIRSRVVELVVLLSRAAVKGGADAEAIFGLNYSYLKEIDSLGSFEDLTYWLSEIMARFTQYVFNFTNAKHVDVIYKAIDYMKHNYMKKLSLEDVAGSVYLSPSYLSKVFKDETNYNFNNYLNLIRIEESKKLLGDSSIPLVDISCKVGYEDQSYFTKVFKKLEGVSPGKYRQMTRNQ